jgi:hypothetical protein
MSAKKGIFVFQMFTAILGVIIIFLGVGALDVLQFSFQMQLLLCALVLVQFTTGIFIMAPVIGVKNEYLAIRFLVLTALQIFSFLAMCLVFTFSGISDGKELMLWYLGLFILLMISQSIIIVKAIKN